jgi:prolyl-tRNA editing enzyme YbaK/EbsC (Cys-tRNA(Pro) deacylase)
MPEDRTIEATVREHLAELGIAYETVEIDPDLADTAAFCEHYGFALDESANCIVVASRDEPPTMAACVVLATTRLDVNNRVRKLLGVRRLSFAPAELTAAVTGMTMGGVTPFALPPDLPLYVDARVMERDRVVVGGGSRSLKLLVPPSALVAAGGEVIQDLAR